MKAFVVIKSSSGAVLRKGVCADEDLEHQAVEGESVIEGDAPLNSYREGDAWVAIPACPGSGFSWDWGAKAWIDRISARERRKQEWGTVRARRDRLLAETDWIAVKAIEEGTAMDSRWRAYRQALRDITQQENPFIISWPERPEA